MVAIKAVSNDNDLMIINRSGITIRTSIEQIRVAGRATQGVRIILREGDEIASVAVVPVTEEEELAEGVVVEGAEGVENTAEAATTTEQTNE